MIERSIKGKSAVSVLQEDFNDIDIYVEDTAKESKKIYTEILSRIFEEKYKIDNIIPLGGSTNVIKEWKANKSNTDGRPKIYIIDGDYHIINDSLSDVLDKEESKNHRGLYILPRYCIENYLIDFDSLIEIIYEEVPDDNRDLISKTLNFDQWFKVNSEILKKLFIYNAICIKYNVPEKTSKLKLSSLLSSESGLCCNVRVNARIAHLEAEIKRKNSLIDVEKEFRARQERVKNINFMSIVTGKDYLFPLVKNYISDKYNCINMSQISLKIRLSKICKITELNLIKDNII